MKRNVIMTKDETEEQILTTSRKSQTDITPSNTTTETQNNILTNRTKSVESSTIEVQSQSKTYETSQWLNKTGNFSDLGKETFPLQTNLFPVQEITNPTTSGTRPNVNSEIFPSQPNTDKINTEKSQGVETVCPNSQKRPGTFAPSSAQAFELNQGLSKGAATKKYILYDNERLDTMDPKYVDNLICEI